MGLTSVGARILAGLALSLGVAAGLATGADVARAQGITLGGPSCPNLPRMNVPPNGRERNLVVCKDTVFALCAASTCTRTGGFITGNDGKTHPAASCTCPVLRGDNIADLAAGNMEGSCEAPPGYVWSTYEINTYYPQYIDGTWQDADADIQICPSEYSYSQCWNWKCELGEVVDGVQLAECTCPIGKTPFDFVTQAGQGNPDACADLPVGGPLFFDPESVLPRR